MKKESKTKIFKQTYLEAANLMLKRHHLTKTLNDSDIQDDTLDALNASDSKQQHTTNSKQNIDIHRLKKRKHDKNKRDVNHSSEDSDCDSVIQTPKKVKVEKVISNRHSLDRENTIEETSSRSSSDEDVENTSLNVKKKQKKSSNSLIKVEVSTSDEEGNIGNFQNNNQNFKSEAILDVKHETINTGKSKLVMQESHKSLETYSTINEYKKIMQSKTDLGNADEEVYLVQMSKSLNPQLLQDKLISFVQETKIRCGDDVYRCNMISEKKNPVNFINCDSLCHFKLEGFLKVHESIKSKNTPINLEYANSIPDIPNLKRRHPLFGSKYKHKINLNENILRKLNEPPENIKLRKHKSKNKRKSTEYADEEMEISFTSYAEENISQKKKRKSNEILQNISMKEKSQFTGHLHRKNHNVINSTMSMSTVSNTLLQLDESDIPKIKKKRHRNTDNIALENFIDNLVKDVSTS